MKKTEKIKLAVVDDAPFIREVVKHIAESDGHIQIVGEACNGVEAIELMKNIQPDVVLMDIVMPKKNGIEATKEILSDNPNIKIIACSTVDQESMIMQALNAGCCNYLVKPFTIEQVSSLVHKTHSGAS